MSGQADTNLLMADTWTRKVWLAAAKEAAARGEPELTQARFAERVGATHAKVRLWVTSANPSLKPAEKIRKAFPSAVAQVDGVAASAAQVSDSPATGSPVTAKSLGDALERELLRRNGSRFTEAQELVLKLERAGQPLTGEQLAALASALLDDDAKGGGPR